MKPQRSQRETLFKKEYPHKDITGKLFYVSSVLNIGKVHSNLRVMNERVGWLNFNVELLKEGMNSFTPREFLMRKN